MATYVNDLRLKEISTGDESGTWGTSTNTNLELIGEALGYATQQVFSSDADATTTVADGASDPARAMYFKITSAGNLTATRTCTIAPNTVSRVMFIENATSGSQSIAISQGSGANVTIATGKTAVVYLDGAGSGAAVVDAMAGVSSGASDTLAEILAAGNATGGTDIAVGTGDDITFADNSKAIFGAGSDLEIYHTGSDSRILDNGTGNLRIMANNLRMQSALGEQYIIADDGGAVTLYNDNTARLATTSSGIDITGTVTADGLTNNGDVVFSKSTTGVPIIKMSGFANANSPYGIINFYNEDGSQQGPNNAVQIKALAKNSDGSGGELAFYTSTGTGSEGADAVERMRIDSSGNLLLNTTNSPTTTKAIISSDYSATGTTNTGLTIAGRQSGNWWNNGIHALGASGLVFSTGTTGTTGADATNERMRIDASGNVGIGVVPTTDHNPVAEALQIGSTGNLYGRSDAETTILSSNSYLSLAGFPKYITTNEASEYTQTSGNHIWYNAPSGTAGASCTLTERMRIDASGNLLVGKTSSAFGTAGIEARAGGTLWATASATNAASFNRLSTDGAIAYFSKDGATVGSIGSRSGVVSYIVLDPRSGVKGAALIGGSVDANNGTINPGKADGDVADDAISLGSSSYRFKDLYLSESVKLSANDVGGAGSNSIDFAHTNHTSGPSAQIHVDYTSDFRANLLFKINKAQSNSAPTEVARFTNGGNLLVGGTSQINSTNTSIYGSSSTNCLGIKNANNNNYLITALNSSNTEVFRVSGTGDVTNTNNSYGGISDARLKSNIIDAPSQLDDIMSVQVRSYTLNSTGEKHLGVIAQELEASGMSGLVSEDKEGMKSVKYSVLYMKAIKAIQEQQATIEALTARIAALES